MHTAIGPHAADWVFLHVPVASMDLQALIQYARFTFGGPILGRCRCNRIDMAGAIVLNAFVKKYAAYVHVCLAFRKLKARILQINQRRPKRLSFLCVL